MAFKLGGSSQEIIKLSLTDIFLQITHLKRKPHFARTSDLNKEQGMRVARTWNVNLEEDFNSILWHGISGLQMKITVRKNCNARIVTYVDTTTTHSACKRRLPFHQTYNISRTLVSNGIVDHSDVVGAAPVKLHLHSRLKTWLVNFYPCISLLQNVHLSL